MQNAVPKGKGGMLAVLGATVEDVNEIIKNSSNAFNCYIANDNCTGQIVVSGELNYLELFSLELKKKKYKKYTAFSKCSISLSSDEKSKRRNEIQNSRYRF